MIAAMLLLSFGGSLTVTGGALASQPGTIEITDESAVIHLDVDARASVAFAQRFQRLGVRVDLGRGDGVMQTLPDREIGDELTITESTDTFGDVLTLALVGERFSPFARRTLQAKTGVDVYFVTGSPQHEFPAKVFTGFVVSSTYDGQPPVATVTALDAAGLYAEKRAKDWSLPPNSGRTWLDITLELLAIGGIPVRSIDIGPDGGGIVNKPHTLGDTPILEFLRDALATRCAEIGFENAGFVARRYDPNLPHVAELNPSNILPQFSIDAPDTLAANVLGVVSVSSTRTEIGGYTTEGPTSVVVVGPYAPATAVQMIDDGVVTDTEAEPIEAVQIISESISTVTKYGGVAVRTEQVERGWLAERAAGAQVVRIGAAEESPGVWPYETQPVPGVVWVYPDGSTRAVPRATFRDLSRTVTTKELDEQGRVIRVRQERDGWRRYLRALFETHDNAGVLTDEPPSDPIPIGDDGQGMQYPTEVYGGLPFGLRHPMELDETLYTLNDAGEILAEQLTERFHELPAEKRRSEGAHGFGLDNRTYHAADVEGVESNFPHVLPWRGLRVTTKTYQVIDEDSYRVITSVRVGDDAPTVTTEGPFVGSLPRAEKAEPSQSSQELYATFADEERIALAGEEIEDIEHNEFIETQAEADAYAKHRARLAGARKLNCSTPIEGLMHKHRMVLVKIPGASIDGLKFEIRYLRRDASAFSQAIVADHYTI